MRSARRCSSHAPSNPLGTVPVEYLDNQATEHRAVGNELSSSGRGLERGRLKAGRGRSTTKNTTMNKPLISYGACDEVFIMGDLGVEIDVSDGVPNLDVFLKGHPGDDLRNAGGARRRGSARSRNDFSADPRRGPTLVLHAVPLRDRRGPERGRRDRQSDVPDSSPPQGGGRDRRTPESEVMSSQLVALAVLSSSGRTIRERLFVRGHRQRF